MSDRDTILSRVERALAGLPRRAALPEYDPELAVMKKLLEGRDVVELFSERIALAAGIALTDPRAVAKRLRESGWMRGYCDPALWPDLRDHFRDGFTIETEFDPGRIDDYAFGITRAAGGIAETGTIILKDESSSRRLAALAPWVHVAVLRREDIHPDVSRAIAALGDDPNVIWCTGSSSTADVESILIRGVHGPGVQIALVEA